MSIDLLNPTQDQVTSAPAANALNFNALVEQTDDVHYSDPFAAEEDEIIDIPSTGSSKEPLKLPSMIAADKAAIVESINNEGMKENYSKKTQFSDQFYGMRSANSYQNLTDENGSKAYISNLSVPVANGVVGTKGERAQVNKNNIDISADFAKMAYIPKPLQKKVIQANGIPEPTKDMIVSPEYTGSSLTHNKEVVVTKGFNDSAPIKATLKSGAPIECVVTTKKEVNPDLMMVTPFVDLAYLAKSTQEDLQKNNVYTKPGLESDATNPRLRVKHSTANAVNGVGGVGEYRLAKNMAEMVGQRHILARGFDNGDPNKAVEVRAAELAMDVIKGAGLLRNMYNNFIEKVAVNGSDGFSSVAMPAYTDSKGVKHEARESQAIEGTAFPPLKDMGLYVSKDEQGNITLAVDPQSTPAQDAARESGLRAMSYAFNVMKSQTINAIERDAQGNPVFGADGSTTNKLAASLDAKGLNGANVVKMLNEIDLNAYTVSIPGENIKVVQPKTVMTYRAYPSTVETAARLALHYDGNEHIFDAKTAKSIDDANIGDSMKDACKFASALYDAMGEPQMPPPYPEPDKTRSDKVAEVLEDVQTQKQAGHGGK